MLGVNCWSKNFTSKIYYFRIYTKKILLFCAKINRKLTFSVVWIFVLIHLVVWSRGLGSSSILRRSSSPPPLTELIHGQRFVIRRGLYFPVNMCKPATCSTKCLKRAIGIWMNPCPCLGNSICSILASVIGCCYSLVLGIVPWTSYCSILLILRFIQMKWD